MSKVSDQLLGLNLDEGAGYFIKESAQSESGVASITNVLLETFKFIGSESRQEYLMPQMTQLNWSMRAFENRIPECELLLDQARGAPSPMESIAAFDELLKLAVGSASAPCMRVIPGTAIMANAYKTAESISDGLNGQFEYDGFIKQNAKRGTKSINPVSYTAQDLKSFATTINANRQPMLSAFDLEVISRIGRILDTWRLAALGKSIQANSISERDAESVMRALALTSEMPAWMKHTVLVEDNGCISIDGEIMTDEAKIRAAMPPNDYGMIYSKKNPNKNKRHIAEWVADHNISMTRLPKQKDVEYVKDEALIGTIVVRDAAGRLSKRTYTQDAFTEGDKPLAGSYVFRLTWGVDRNDEPVVEYYITEKIKGSESVAYATALSDAYRTFSRYHAGLPNSHGSGVSVASRILEVRRSLSTRAMLVPGIKSTLTKLKNELKGVNDEAAMKLIDALDDLDLVADAASMDRVVLNASEVYNTMRAQMPSVRDLQAKSLEEGAVAAGYSVIGSGRYAPTSKDCTVLVPIVGRGVAPVHYHLDGSDLVADRVLNVAVILEEPPSTVYSPVKTMMATAFLARLFGYLNGKHTPAGYNFDEYDESNVYGVGLKRPCPRSLLNRQLDRYEQALVHVIENTTVDGMPDVLRAVQKLVDARYFLNHMDEVVDTIIMREDWIYMLQSLIISLMVHDGAEIKDSDGHAIRSVDAGIVPRRAAEFIFEKVLSDLKDRDSFREAVDLATQYGISTPPEVTAQANMARIIRGEVLFARAASGLELLTSLLDGSNALVKNVHVGTIQHLIDIELAQELMTALTTVFNRDYLGLVNRVEFETPWETAEWLTQFSAYAFSVSAAPIKYQAVDVARECAVDSKMASVTTALARVGFSWVEIAPADLRVRGADSSSYKLTDPLPMAGYGDGGFYNDAPVAHQCLKITTVVPTYDIEAYNLVKAYLTMNTSRTYFVQPIGKDVADEYTMTLRTDIPDGLLDLIINEKATGKRNKFATEGIKFEKTPALSNVALIMPYVAAYLTKPAITRDKSIPQIIQVDADKSLAGTSGVVIIPEMPSNNMLSTTNGVAVTVTDKRSVSTALPWVGA